MDATELRPANDANRQLFLEYLGAIQEPLYTHEQLASLLRGFIDKDLKPNRSNLIDFGAMARDGAPPLKRPMHPWLADRLSTLYPPVTDLRVDSTDRNDVFNLKVEILEELFQIVSGKNTSPDPWPGLIKHVLGLERKGRQDRICTFFDRDQSYIRRSLWSKSAGHAKFSHPGGVSDLLEVIGYFMLHKSDLNRLAEMLLALGLLKFDKRRGRSKISTDIYSKTSPDKHHQIDFFLAFIVQSQPDQKINFFWTRYDLHFVMNALFGNEWDAHRRFRVSDRFWTEISREFINKNSFIQNDKNSDEWEIVYEGCRPFTIRAAGLSCIARLLEIPGAIIPMEKLHEELMKSPGRRGNRQKAKSASKKLSSDRKIQMAVYNSIYDEGRAISAIEEKCPPLADHLSRELDDNRGTDYWYHGDKFSYLNVKFAA